MTAEALQGQRLTGVCGGASLLYWIATQKGKQYEDARILAAGLIVLATPHFILAQDQMVAKAATAMKIAEARKANAKLMHNIPGTPVRN